MLTMVLIYLILIKINRFLFNLFNSELNALSFLSISLPSFGNLSTLILEIFRQLLLYRYECHSNFANYSTSQSHFYVHH